MCFIIKTNGSFETFFSVFFSISCVVSYMQKRILSFHFLQTFKVSIFRPALFPILQPTHTYNTVHNILELGVFYTYVNVPRLSPITILIVPGMGVFRSNIVSGVAEGGEAFCRLTIYEISFTF